MRTIKELIEELNKFPEDAICWAYEGEVTGIGVSYESVDGFIYCDESDEQKETEVLDEH